MHGTDLPPRAAAPQQIIRGDAEVIRKKAKRQRWDIDLSIFHSLIMDKGNLKHFCHIRLPQMPFIPQGTQSFSKYF